MLPFSSLLMTLSLWAAVPLVGCSSGTSAPPALAGADPSPDATPSSGDVDAGVVDAPEPSTDASTRSDGGVAAPLRVITDFEAGCSSGLTADVRVPGRHAFSSFVLEDEAGTNETLRGACAIVQRIALEAGHRVPAGEVVVRGEADLSASGRGAVRVRVAARGSATHEESYRAFGDAAFMGPFEVRAAWPAIDGCAGDVQLEVETLVTALLRADRENDDPRRIALSTLDLPVLEAVPCASTNAGEGTGG